jgi:hypothetical protein
MSNGEERPNRKLGKSNVGGAGYVPPTLCPRSANFSANAAANVERTGNPRSVYFKYFRLAGRAVKIIPKTPQKGSTQ